MLTTVHSAPVLRPQVPSTLAPAVGFNDRSSASTMVDLSKALADCGVVSSRRVIATGESLYEAGDVFQSLHVLRAGMIKKVRTAPDGRAQVVGLKFRGDWVGFDGLVDGRFTCDAIALDICEVWTLRYDELLCACARDAAMLMAFNQAMGRELARERESHMSICTLPADARVADFLRNWAETLEQRGLRFDQISMRLTRAEIGNYLGITLETVSRALSRLVKAKLIDFAGGDRRELRITDLDALAAFVDQCVERPGILH